MPENTTSHGDPLVQPPDSPSYQPIPPELGQILADHKVWLESGGRSGKQANLPDYDFKGLDLSQVNLERANLEGAQFQKAKLAGANLKQTRLRGADFSEADVAGTDFRDADLEKVELASSTDLDIPLLARADLGDCDLPEDRQEFPVLDYVAEASRATSHIFVTLMIGAGYVGVTVFTTSDVVLLTNTGTTSLPILGNVISMAWFYIAAPFLLLATYIYFHLSLQHLWEALATLPAVFPDGQRLDQKVYPWLFNWLPSYYFVQLKDRRPYFVHLQCAIASFFAWYFVPLILLELWFRHLYARDQITTAWHLMILTAAAWFCFRFCHFAKITLQGHTWRRGRGILPDVARTLGVLICLAFITGGFIEGFPPGLGKELSVPTLSTYDPRKLVPLGLDYFGYSIGVNFEEAEVSSRYGKGNDQSEDKAPGKDSALLVKGAPLKERNLRHANGRGAFMVRADLRGANLSGAYLRGANLKAAKAGEAGYPELHVNMINAFLHKANLTGACLYKADLYRANLTHAELKGCDLELAVLAEAQLNHAKFQGAKLIRTILRAADIQGADFTGAQGLEKRQIEEAKNWLLAYYDAKFLKDLGLPEEHNRQVNKQDLSGRELNGRDLHEADLAGFTLKETQFVGANLAGAHLGRTNLQGAPLNNANLKKSVLRQAVFQGADLGDADLAEADLYLANFQGATGLRAGQLQAAKNWSMALYDKEMISRLKLPENHNARVHTRKFGKYSLNGIELGYNLSKAALKDTFLVDADFRGANLRGADLSGAELRGADLRGADLEGADLTKAFMAGADLRGANLKGATLKDTFLGKADKLKGADLREVRGLTKSQLAEAKVDSTTKLP